MDTRSSHPLTERYDREAAAYRDLWAPVLRRAALRLLPRLSGDRVRRVLDVGTGVGALLPDLSREFPHARILGVDRSRGMLAHAPSRYPRIVMDAEALALRPGTMDRVLMFFMLFHLPSPVNGLREARRVLRPGGSVATITWGGELESRATLAWSRCLDDFGADPADSAAASRHDRVDTTGRMEALLEEAGFGEVDCWNEEIEERIDAEHLLRLRTSLGGALPRFESLAPETRESCLVQARRVMERLDADAFVARARLVYSIARVERASTPRAAGAGARATRRGHGARRQDSR